MTSLRIVPAGRGLRGSVRVPSDKSVSHRAAILAALAPGETRIRNYMEGRTTAATLSCLRSLGVESNKVVEGELVVRGRGLRGLQEASEVLFCQGSGTTMRLLAGVAAGQPGLTVLDGTPALRRRPMARVAEPLRAMGATVLAREGGRLPPLAIQGGQLRGVDWTLPVASAQAKSAVLLAGLWAEGPTTVREPGPSRDHSERMLRAFGVAVESTDAGAGRVVHLSPPERLQSPGLLSIPGDISSAAFLLVAALLVPGSQVAVEGVGINPTRTGLLDVLRAMGARIDEENLREESGEPVADLTATYCEGLAATEVGGELVPRAIDEFPTLAVVATQAKGRTVVRDAAELRVKESDRISALAEELRRLGAAVEERADGFAIDGPTRLRGAHVNAHGDHRLAMALAIAGLLAKGETVVEGWECVADSFPEFEATLAQVAGREVSG